MALILLRHQPGVEVLEYQIQEKTFSLESLDDWAHVLAEELFGISDYDLEDSEHEDRFQEVFRMFRDESDAYWASHGWDVTNGEGKQLKVMEYFTRPMVCMVEKLHPDARFTMASNAWGQQLEAEAVRFRSKHDTIRRHPR